MAKLPKPTGNFRLHDGDQSSPIVGRWIWAAEPGTVWAKLKGARDSVAELAAGVRANRQTLQASGKYTDAGIDEQLLGTVPDMAKALRRAERVAANARAEIAKRRGDLKLKPPDPANLASRVGSPRASNLSTQSAAEGSRRDHTQRKSRSETRRGNLVCPDSIIWGFPDALRHAEKSGNRGGEPWR